MLETLYQWIQNSYLFIAVFGTSVFVIQFILTMVGIASDVPGDADFTVETHDVADIQGINFFSLKAICGFITFYGWGGVFFGDGWGGFAIALACGAVMMVLIALAISLMFKMQQSGNLTDADYIGRTGTVYLGVPGNRAPGGMVQVVFSDRTRQVHARSDVALPTGSTVKITEALGGGEFLVASAD